MKSAGRAFLCTTMAFAEFSRPVRSVNCGVLSKESSQRSLSDEAGAGWGGGRNLSTKIVTHPESINLFIRFSVALAKPSSHKATLLE